MSEGQEMTAAEKKAAAEANAAEVRAAKEAEAAAKREAKEQAKRDAEAKRAADAAARKEAAEKAKAEAKAKREADAQAKREAKEREAEAKRQAREAARGQEQNGVRAPKAETLCGKAWAVFDEVSQSNAQRGEKRPATIAESLELARGRGLNEGNVRTEYARWRKYHGVTGRIVVPKPAAQQAEGQPAEAPLTKKQLKEQKAAQAAQAAADAAQAAGQQAAA